MFTRNASSRKIRNPRYCPEVLGRKLNPSGIGGPTSAAHVAMMAANTNTPLPPPPPTNPPPDSTPVGGTPMPV